MDIWNAAALGNVEDLQQHIDAGAELDRLKNVDGCTPLSVAAVFGQKEAVSILIEAGSDLNATNNRGGTALHLACFFGKPEVVRLLLKSGADRTARNREDRVALEQATFELNAETKAVYRHAFGAIGMELDFEELERAREEIVAMFQ